MKRLAGLIALAGIVLVGLAAAATPKPYVQFHSSTYHDGGETPGSHTVWVRVDIKPSGATTHVYFRTTDGTARGADNCSGTDTPDYVTVNDYLIVTDHQSSVLVPIKVCGEGTLKPAPVDDYVNVELYNPFAGTHLGPRSTARVNFLEGSQ